MALDNCAILQSSTLPHKSGIGRHCCWLSHALGHPEPMTPPFLIAVQQLSTSQEHDESLFVQIRYRSQNIEEEAEEVARDKC